LTVMQEHPTVQHDHWKVLGRGNAFKELGGWYMIWLCRGVNLHWRYSNLTYKDFILQWINIMKQVIILDTYDSAWLLT
jgi:hypothetical protein